MTDDKKQEDFSIENDHSPQVKDRETFVSSGHKQKIGLAGLALVCLLVFYYIVFSGSGTDDQEGSLKKPTVESEKSLDDASRLDVKGMQKVPEDYDERIVLPPELPKLPESPGIPDIPLPPKIAPPQVSPVEPISPQLPGAPPPTKQIEQPGKSGMYRQDRQTPMLVISGGGVGTNQSAQVKSSGINITDPSQILDPTKLEDLKKSLQNNKVTATEDSELQRTGNQQLATRVGNLNYIVGEGKMIDAVLETAVNTDLKGKIRAIVSRDVYAESGNRVLVPKGSRLIGWRCCK